MSSDGTKPSLDFDLTDGAPAPTEPRPASPRQPIPTPPTASESRRPWAGAGPVRVAVRPTDSRPRSLSSTLSTTLGSAVFFFVMESLVFGKAFAFGLTAMIAMHECGHALAAKYYRRGYAGMYFMPFVGAAVRLRQRVGRADLSEDAMIGIAGPALGAAAGVLFAALFLMSHQPVFLLLARMTFGLNLINLTPMQPLDGSWILPAIRTKSPNAAALPPSTRQRIATMYFGLSAFLLVAFILALI